MKILRKTLATAILGLSLVSTSAFAGSLGQKAALSALQSGPLNFDAGSVGTFDGGAANGGSFLFKHGSSREKGTYEVAENGVVTCYKKNGKPYYSFVVEKENGVKSIRYLSGRYKGKSFTFK